MKKYSFLIISLIFLTISSSNAQVKLVFNGGTQFPISDFLLLVNTGYGFTAIGEYTISSSASSSIALTTSVGYNRWKFNETIFFGLFSFLSDYNIHTIPIMGGVKFFFKSFYFGSSIGVSVSGTNVPTFPTTSTGTTITTVDKNTSTDFIWTPIIGLRIKKIDFNIKYQNIRSNGSTTSWIGFNAGYAFGG